MTGEDAPAPPPPASEPAPGQGPWDAIAHVRPAAKWTFGVLLAIDLVALLFVLSFANITAEGPAQRSLAHSIAILSEIDTYLDDHYDAIRQEASETAPAETIAPPDFIVPAVAIEAQDILERDRDAFRSLLLQRAAREVHDEGTAALLDEDREADVTFFSTQGAVRTGMDFLRPTPHGALTVTTYALAALALVLAAALAAVTRGYGRLAGAGLSVLLAALPFLILAIAVRFALRLTADGVDGYLAKELLQLGEELTWAPIRNGIIFAVGGGAVLLSGFVFGRWAEMRAKAA